MRLNIFLIIIILFFLIIIKVIKEKNTFKDKDFNDIILENNNYKKKIILTPVGGLGNRIKLINNFYPYANKLKRKIYIKWNKGKALNSDFEILFTSPKLNYYQNNYDNKKINTYTSHVSSGSNYMKNFIKGKKHIDEIKYDNNDIVEFSAFEFTSNQNYFIKTLRPSNVIKNKINNFFPENKNIIGIHIRCSDRFNCLKNPLLNNVKTNIKEITNKFPDYLLFLATDDVKVRNILKNIYGKRLITSNIKLVSNKNNMNILRNTEQGIIDGVVDLFCLSYCKKLIGFKISTFFNLAKRMSNLTKDDVYYIPLE